MRPALSALLLALSPSLAPFYALAENLPTSIIEIEDSLFTQHAELKKALLSEQADKDQLTQQKDKIAKLTQQVAKSEEQLTTAKAKLDHDFKRLTDDPNVDIETSQAHYQEAWSQLKQVKKERLLAEQKLEELTVTAGLSDQKVVSIKK